MCLWHLVSIKNKSEHQSSNKDSQRPFWTFRGLHTRKRGLLRQNVQSSPELRQTLCHPIYLPCFRHGLDRRCTSLEIHARSAIRLSCDIDATPMLPQTKTLCFCDHWCTVSQPLDTKSWKSSMLESSISLRKFTSPRLHSHFPIPICETMAKHGDNALGRCFQNNLARTLPPIFLHKLKLHSAFVNICPID